MTTPVLHLRDLLFRWPGAAREGEFALHLPQLSIPPGGQVFLHGPSGSGKSTLLNLISGVLPVQQGTIDLLGEPFSRWGAARRDRFRADHLGIIFQQFNLIPYLSVLENVLLPCRFSRRRAERAGALTHPDGAAASAQALLGRLDIGPEFYGRRAQTLSVGQQQRVAAARALIGRPDLIVADEPTSALDAQRQAAFLALLRTEALAGESALVFVSHDLSLAGQFSQHLEIGS